MLLENRMYCENCHLIKTSKQLKLCWESVKNRLQKIELAYSEKKKLIIKTHEKLEQGETNFIPSYYIENFFHNLNFTFCDYEFIQERILKYYFFVQKELSSFFFQWVKMFDKEAQSFDFWMLENKEYMMSISDEENFKYLELIWSYANLYKHNSAKSSRIVKKMLKHSPKNLVLSFDSMNQNIIKLIDLSLNKLIKSKIRDN